MAFWYRWPSWITELLGGAALSGVLMGLGLLVGSLTGFRDWWRAPVFAFVVGAFVSVTYEMFFDRNGWSWRDVEQRTAGQALGIALFLLLR